MKLTTIGYQRILFSLLGFLSGLPLVLFTETLQAWYATLGHPATSVALLTYLTLPYAIKPIFAYLIDLATYNNRINYWNIFNICTLCLVFSLYVCTYLDPSQDILGHLGIILIGCCLSSCLDITIDTLRLIHVPSDELASVNTLFVGAYRLSWIVGGGLALTLVQPLSWASVYRIMTCVFFIVWVLSYWTHHLSKNTHSNEEKIEETQKDKEKTSLITTLLHWVSQPEILITIIMIISLKMHESLVKPLLMAYLINHIKMNLADIGMWYKTVGFGLILLGSYTSGLVNKHYKVHHSLQYYCLLEIMCSFMFSASLYTTYPYVFTVMAILLECFCIGSVTTGVIMIMSRLCNRPAAGSQFALITSILRIEQLIFATIGSQIYAHFGWQGVWLTSMMISSLALALVSGLPLNKRFLSMTQRATYS